MRLRLRLLRYVFHKLRKALQHIVRWRRLSRSFDRCRGFYRGLNRRRGSFRRSRGRCLWRFFCWCFLLSKH